MNDGPTKVMVTAEAFAAIKAEERPLNRIEDLKAAMAWWNSLTRQQQDALRQQADMRAADKITRHWQANGRPPPAAPAPSPEFKFDHLPDGST